MIKHIDSRRTALIFQDHLLIPYLVDLFFLELEKNVNQKNRFNVALSGGSTPKQLYKAISHDPRAKTQNWEKVHMYFGDERAVSFDHPDSNYKMSLDAGFSLIHGLHMHPMHALEQTQDAARDYEHKLPDRLDLIFLGMGEDGHTASLFPNDPMCLVNDRKVAFGYVESKQASRMTLTFDYINKASKILCLVTGANKAQIVHEVLSETGTRYPSYHIGSKNNPCYFILDTKAATLI